MTANIGITAVLTLCPRGLELDMGMGYVFAVSAATGAFCFKFFLNSVLTTVHVTVNAWIFCCCLKVVFRYFVHESRQLTKLVKVGL